MNAGKRDGSQAVIELFAGSLVFTISFRETETSRKGLIRIQVQICLILKLLVDVSLASSGLLILPTAFLESSGEATTESGRLTRRFRILSSHRGRICRSPY
jgi:hypothetical protein